MERNDVGHVQKLPHCSPGTCQLGCLSWEGGREATGRRGAYGKPSPIQLLACGECRLRGGRSSNFQKTSRSTRISNTIFLLFPSFFVVVKCTRHQIYHRHHLSVCSPAVRSTLTLSCGRHHHPCPELFSSYQTDALSPSSDKAP